jgi:hypothetical protein
VLESQRDELQKRFLENRDRRGTVRPDCNRRIDLPDRVIGIAASSPRTLSPGKEMPMRLSLLTSLGLAAFLGIMAVDTPDANAVASRTVVSTPGRTTVVNTKRPRVAMVRRSRVAMARRARLARGAVVCRTRIINGVRVRRCF